MKVIYHADCLLHNPPHEILSGRLVPYLESPSRVERIKHALEEHGLFEMSNDVDETLDLDKYILQVHTEDYLDYLKTAYKNWVDDGGDKSAVWPETFAHIALTRNNPALLKNLSPIAKAGLYCFDLSCPITADTYKAILASLRVTLTAASLMVVGTRKQERAVFALSRPPGHHAGPSICGGYCFLNNVAIAARFVQLKSGSDTMYSPPPIAILDIDYHHGNGTQDIFYTDSSVRYVSIHAQDDYPYFTGAASERGESGGHGFNMNFPLPRRTTGDDEYCATLSEAIRHIQVFDPKCLIVSLGVDTYIDDPICDFKITTMGYKRIGQSIASINKPTMFVMEGGYHLDTLGENVRNVLIGFEERIPETNVII